MLEKAVFYIQLTKPRIVLLFALTGLTGMLVEGSMKGSSLQFWAILLGIILTAGSANALNQYLDYDIDSQMERTKKKRPLPLGKLEPHHAFYFGIVTGVIATALLYWYGNALTALLGVGTIVFYTVIYTIWLKPRTPYNIVIGGAAGATAPLIGWAASTGEISGIAFVLFLIIFMWTPPHFWALALCIKEDYAKVSIPMLPVTSGDEVTRKQIFIYTLLLLPLTFFVGFTKQCGWFYLISSLLLGFEFLRRTTKLLKFRDVASSWKLFKYSIVYLLCLFLAIIVDVVWITKAFAAEERPAILDGVGIEEKLGQTIDPELSFKNEKGEVVKFGSFLNTKKPLLLFLAYYRCPNLCNLFLNGATDTLRKLTLNPTKDFDILTISIDPTETPQIASQKKENYIKAVGRAEYRSNWNFLVNDKISVKNDETTSVKALANKVGFHYKYDKSQDQYAHVSAIVVLTPQGKISRYLYGIEFNPQDLKLALLEASNGKIGNALDRFLLFCYNYDPKTKKYSLYSMNLMKTGAGFTVMFLGTYLFSQFRRSRKGVS